MLLPQYFFSSAWSAFICGHLHLASRSRPMRPAPRAGAGDARVRRRPSRARRAAPVRVAEQWPDAAKLLETTVTAAAAAGTAGRRRP